MAFRWLEEEEDDGILQSILDVGSRTGSGVLDVLMQLDRPRRALWLGIEEATEGGDIGDILESAGKGWRLEEDIRTQDFMSPEFREENPILAGIGGFVGDVLGDPLTYLGAGLARTAGKGIAAASPQFVKNMGAQFGETGLANALGIYGGRSLEAKKLFLKHKDRLAKEKFDIREEVTNLRTEIQKIAEDTGTEYKDVARALNESLENPQVLQPNQTADMFHLLETGNEIGTRTSAQVLARELGVESDAALELSGRLRSMYKGILDSEVAAGMKISDVVERAEELGVSDYVLHFLTQAARQRTDAKSFKDFFSWKKKGVPETHTSALARDIDSTIKDINDRHMAHAKKMGIKNPTPYFHEDSALLMGIRKGRSAEALSGINYLKALGDRFGSTKKTKNMVELPNQPALKGVYFDPEVAKIIGRHHKNFTDIPSTNEFVKFFDGVQGLWKMWSLGVRPAYHTRNIVGNIWNAYSLAGVKGPSGMKAYRDAGRMQNSAWRNDVPTDDVMVKMKVDGETVNLSSKEVMDLALERGVMGRGQYSGDIVNVLEEDVARGGISRLQGMAKNQKERYRLLKGAQSSTREMGSDIPWGGMQGKAFGSQALPLKWGFAFGNMAEGNARIAVFLDAMRKGKSADEAAMLVKKTLFDYSDLSAFERNVMKRIIPFYTWTRKNIPAQIEGILKNPQRYQKITTARENIEYRHGRPDPEFTEWWGKRVPIYIGKEVEGDVWNLVSLLNYAPVADLERLGSPAQLVTEMVSPLIKEPLEQLFNYSSYRGKAIQKYEGQTQDFLGVKMPKRLAKLAENLVPIAELNRLNPFGMFGEALLQDSGKIARTPSVFGVEREQTGGYDLERGSRLLRYITGLRAYPVDESKGQYWAKRNLQKDLSVLKTYLNRARRSGRQREADELLKLIQSVMRGQEENPLLRRTI